MAHQKRLATIEDTHEVGIDVDDSSVWMRPDVDLLFHMPDKRDGVDVPSGLQLRFSEGGPHSLMYICDKAGYPIAHIGGADLARFLSRAVCRFNSPSQARHASNVVCISTAR